MRNNQNVAVFADVDNLYHGAYRRYRGRLNYQLFLTKLVEEQGRLQVALAYGKSEDQRVGSFRTFLRHIGFECRWANLDYDWNVGIAMDVMRQLDKVDLVVLMSSDPFLAPCAEYVKQQGIKCYCYGFKISEELKRASDRFIEISDEFIIKGDDNERTGVA